jgi:hypothetical protein
MGGVVTVPPLCACSGMSWADLYLYTSKSRFPTMFQCKDINYSVSPQPFY